MFTLSRSRYETGSVPCPARCPCGVQPRGQHKWRGRSSVAPPAVTTVRARTLFVPLDEGGRAETVARRLAQAIGLGLLLDGERLPAESQLASQFGVSPVTLREALAILRTMGL